jgi:hypothetical protein
VSQPSLGALLDEAARQVPGCQARDAEGARTWEAAGRVFVVQSGPAVEFRLDAAIGAAARRTPDTAASDRGAEWVTFRPGSLDPYAIDRVRAWFAAAHRRASGGGSEPGIATSGSPVP